MWSRATKGQKRKRPVYWAFGIIMSIAPKLFLDQLGAWISSEAGSPRGLQSFVHCCQERIMWENNGVACGGAGESDFVNNEKGFILKDNRDNPKWELDSTISLQLTDSLVRWITQHEKTADATTTQKHYPELGSDTYISLEFLLSFLRRHYTRKAVVAFLNVGCFLRLWFFTLR